MVSTSERKISLCKLHNSSLDDDQFAVETHSLCSLPSLHPEGTIDEIFRQPTYSPFGDLLALTCYENTQNQQNPVSIVLVKRMKTSSKDLIGLDLIRIRTDRISFYHYWSPDGK